MALALFRRTRGWPLVTRERFYHEVIESDRPVLVELWREGVDYDAFERAIESVARERRGDFKLVRIRMDDFRDLLEAYRENKGYTAIDFDRHPAAALFRQGRLITTFNPILPLGEESVQYHDVRYQFQRFLQKFVYFDPAKLTFNHKKPEAPGAAEAKAKVQPKAKPAEAAAKAGEAAATGAVPAADDKAARIAAAKAAAAAKLAAKKAVQAQAAQGEAAGQSPAGKEGSEGSPS